MAAGAIAAAAAPRRSFRAVAAVCAICAVLPDLDGLRRLAGGTDFSFLGGHRGFTHSVVFAIGAATVVSLAAAQRLGVPRLRLFVLIAAATASHGFLDAFTNYGSGEGVAFFSPISVERYLAPWQPIRGEFSELLICLVPLTLLTLLTLRLRNLPTGVPGRQAAVQLGLDRPSDPGSPAR